MVEMVIMEETTKMRTMKKRKNHLGEVHPVDETAGLWELLPTEMRTKIAKLKKRRLHREDVKERELDRARAELLHGAGEHGRQWEPTAFAGRPLRMQITPPGPFKKFEF